MELGTERARFSFSIKPSSAGTQRAGGRAHARHYLPRRPRRGRDVHPERPRAPIAVYAGAEPMAHAGTNASVAGIETRSVANLEWSPVLAGAVLAAAPPFVLLAFGTAIGLSATSPWPHSGLPSRVIAGLAVFWAMAQQIGAFLAGGYVAGRMGSQWTRPRTDEVEFRDGLHGALVWAVGIVI